MKSNQELLDDYKKSNKERRAKIVAKAGFATEQEYLDSLEDEAGGVVGGKLGKFFGKTSKTEEDTEGMLDQVICFDTTGSMRSYIGAVRAHVKELIPKLFAENKNLRLKLVAFGDYCDMINSSTFGRAYQETQLSNNQNELIDFVNKAENTSGGDGDEFYELVIKKVVEETPWREGARKAVLLISDANPHPIGYSYHDRVKNNQIDWREEAKKSAAKGIAWDTLTCEPMYVHTFYKPLSDLTNGVSIPFKSSEKTHTIVDAATNVRGGMSGKAAFLASYAGASAMDAELTGSFKSLGDLLDDEDSREKFRRITKSKEEALKKLKK